MTAGVWIHVIAGIVALISGYFALAVRKGSSPHRRAGALFVLTMTVMAISATMLAIHHGERLNTIAGLLALYLTLTAWVTVRRPEGASRQFERGAAVLAVGIAGVAIWFGLIAASPEGLTDAGSETGRLPVPYFVFGLIAALGALFDVRMILRRGLRGSARISRHLWRMTMALTIAAAAFFLGQADKMPEALRGPHLIAPPVIALGLLVFWLAWVRLHRDWRDLDANAQRNSGRAGPA